MKVRTVIAHANPFGRGRGKSVDTEYDLPADEARAAINAGLVERVDGKKPSKS